MSSGKRALYLQITDTLRQRVVTGVYEPGEVLPPIPDLAKEFGVSAMPVRQALDRLKAQGVLVSRQGLGNFVRQLPPLRHHGTDRYRRRVWLHAGQAILEGEAGAQKYRVEQEVRELAEVDATEYVAERLQIEPGAKVWVRRRRTLIDEMPNQLADSYYPLAIADAVPQLREENTGPGGGFARLHEAGYEPTHGIEEIVVRLEPTEEETTLLDLPDEMPVIDWTRTVYDQKDRPIEVLLGVRHPLLVKFAYSFNFED
ncbi:GntR family transcriptional regulator [Amycolatopsis sp. WAC 04197]|uniref:GntR family transcriptional regulator n=1 Tax=Amycolatopsis sp. WAC 04197 TaxID=2203199 RepID=UPI000F7AEF92|nr:GntR family transcriptional regulator [Amycolatopsis sp. WAC 04197]RSN38550.1 GntR family transcriptional regulator [Amycolatopsis sp. WAC 04197]